MLKALGVHLPDLVRSLDQDVWTYQRVLEGAWGFDRLWRNVGPSRLTVHVHEPFEGPPFWHTHCQALSVLLLSTAAVYELRTRSGTDLPEVRSVAHGVFAYEMAPESQHAVRVLGVPSAVTVCLFDLCDAKLSAHPTPLYLSHTEAGVLERAIRLRMFHEKQRATALNPT